MQKVAAYCRVSTDKEEQAQSLINQKRYFDEYIRRHADWNLVNVYFDEGTSGTQTRKREGFNRMIGDALSGQIDLILTKEVSRFARNTVDALAYTRMLRERRIGVIFILDNIDTRDCDGELRLTLMASLAQEESRKISERIKWGQRRRMEQGVVFGRDLLGYTVRDGQLLINEAEAAVVRRIFHKYTDEEKSARQIAAELLAEGYPPKYAARWSPGVIIKILRNEKYAGDLCQKKTYTPDYLTHQKRANHGEEDLICIRGHHPPIIERSLWERTQEALARRARRPRRSGNPLCHAGSKMSDTCDDTAI